MADLSDREPADRRATWLGLRTLRRRPRLVGRTEEGRPIFEVASTRLIYDPEATNFRRLVQCSRCGRDAAGDRVITPADLTRGPGPILCDRCVQAPTMPWKGESRRVRRAPAAERRPANARREPSSDSDPSQPAIDAALSAVRDELTQLKERLQAEATERSRADGVTRIELQRAVERRLAGLTRNTPPALENLRDRVDQLTEYLAGLAGLVREDHQMREALERRLDALEAAADHDRRRLEDELSLERQALAAVDGLVRNVPDGR